MARRRRPQRKPRGRNNTRTINAINNIISGRQALVAGDITALGIGRTKQSRRRRAMGTARQKRFQMAAEQLGSYCREIDGQHKYIMAWKYMKKLGISRILNWTKDVDEIREREAEWVRADDFIGDRRDIIRHRYRREYADGRRF